MRGIVPFLWFADNNAEKAIRHCHGVFPDSRLISVQRCPQEAPDPMSPAWPARSHGWV